MSSVARLLVLLSAVAAAGGSVVQHQQQPAAEETAGPPNRSARCEDACAHYYDCTKTGTQAERDECVTTCEQQRPDPNQLAVYVAMDCDTAISVVEQSGGIGAAER